MLAEVIETEECIYCGATADLTREHIIPFGLEGALVLPIGSCRPCARITSEFEGRVMRGFMFDARTAGQFPTRRPKERRDSVTHRLLDEAGKVRAVEVPVGEASGTALLPTFERAGRLVGRPYGRGVTINGARGIAFGGNPRDVVKKHGAGGGHEGEPDRPHAEVASG